MRIVRYISLCALLCFSVFKAEAQCGSGTPIFTVDLSSNPNMAWSSPDTQRVDTCCGASAPDKCVAFVVTLHPQAEGIIFDICDGAVPPGALFYQVGCGPQSQVGQALCLSGPGPHFITFCKPGNNINKYCITSIAEPVPGPNTAVNDGCVGQLYVEGYDIDSIEWNSVYPGAQGAYNYMLDCTSGCDTVNVNGGVNPPDTVIFEACGPLLGGCSSSDTCVQLSAYFFSTLEAVISPEEPTVCFGATGTYIHASGSGGTPPYIFTWSTGAAADSIYVNVGTYYLEVADSSGCPPSYDTVTVTSFALPIEAQAGQDTVICSASASTTLNGSVVAASGGRWIGNGGTFSPDSLTLNASYTASSTEVTAGYSNLLLITTGNGTCPPDTDTVVIYWHQFSTIAELDSIPVSCFGGNDGQAFVTSVSGMSLTNIQWNSIPTQNGDTAFNLTAGTYSVVLTDSLGCLDTTNVVVTEPTIVGINQVTLTNVTCIGYQDGTLEVTGTGGKSPYSYAWSNGMNGASNDSLAPGTYTITVTDANGCSTTGAYTITEPGGINISITTVNVSCYGQNTGAASATVTGATGSVSYSWSNSSTNPIVFALAADTYQLTVTYSLGCTDSAVAIITQPDSLELSTSSMDITCYGFGDGIISTIVAGGVSAYSYSWSNSATTNSITSLSSGTYTVTLTDNNGCSRTASSTIVEPSELSSGFGSTNITCYGDNDGTAYVQPSGGIPSYEISWSSGSSQDSIQNLSPGLYYVILSDTNGCTVTDSFNITQPPVLDLLTTSDSVDCYGNATGSATAATSGGTAPYQWLWSNSATTQGISNLMAGLYTVTVTDDNGCERTDQIMVYEPTELQLSLTKVNISCFGMNDGELVTLFSGGITPYNFQWSNNATTTSQDSLGPGTYAITLTDNNGCTLDSSLTLIEPGILGINPVVDNVKCFGNSDGSITTGVTGGTSPYYFSWSTGSAAISLLNKPIGTYSVTITDQNGCEDDTTITLTEPAVLTADLVPTNATCYGYSDGQIVATVSGGTTAYAYQWSNGQASSTAINLGQGVYHFTVTDSNNCQFQSMKTISHPNQITAQGSPNVEICLNTSANISVVGYGRSGGYNYLWSNALPDQPSHTVSPTATTTYTVSVTDSNNCPPAIENIVVTVKPVVFDDIALTLDPLEVCVGESSKLKGVYQGDPAGYTFVWSHGLGTAAIPGTHTVSPTENTTYGITIIDECGFKNRDSITLIVNPIPVLALPDVLHEGCLPLTVTHSIDVPGVIITSYNWKLGNTQTSSHSNPTTTYPNAGEYIVSVELISDKGCKSEGKSTGKVIVHDTPKADFILDPDHVDTDNPEVNGIDKSERALFYKWTTEDGGYYETQNITHRFSDWGEYLITLIVNDQYGCKDTAIAKAIVDPVLVFEAPNAFTPNLLNPGDGYYDPSAMDNDIFYLITKYVKSFHMLVFNRWGEIVFETFDPLQGWNGYYKGEMAPMGMYVWRADIVYVTDKTQIETGNVTLLR